MKKCQEGYISRYKNILKNLIFIIIENFFVCTYNVKGLIFKNYIEFWEEINYEV